MTRRHSLLISAGAILAILLAETPGIDAIKKHVKRPRPSKSGKSGSSPRSKVKTEPQTLGDLAGLPELPPVVAEDRIADDGLDSDSKTIGDTEITPTTNAVSAHRSTESTSVDTSTVKGTTTVRIETSDVTSAGNTVTVDASLNDTPLGESTIDSTPPNADTTTLFLSKIDGDEEAADTETDTVAPLASNESTVENGISDTASDGITPEPSTADENAAEASTGEGGEDADGDVQEKESARPSASVEHSSAGMGMQSVIILFAIAAVVVGAITMKRFNTHRRRRKRTRGTPFNSSSYGTMLSGDYSLFWRDNGSGDYDKVGDLCESPEPTVELYSQDVFDELKEESSTDGIYESPLSCTSQQDDGLYEVIEPCPEVSAYACVDLDSAVVERYGGMALYASKIEIGHDYAARADLPLAQKNIDDSKFSDDTIHSNDDVYGNMVLQYRNAADSTAEGCTCESHDGNDVYGTIVRQNENGSVLSGRSCPDESLYDNAANMEQERSLTESYRMQVGNLCSDPAHIEQPDDGLDIYGYAADVGIEPKEYSIDSIEITENQAEVQQTKIFTAPVTQAVSISRGNQFTSKGAGRLAGSPFLQNESQLLDGPPDIILNEDESDV